MEHGGLMSDPKFKFAIGVQIPCVCRDSSCDLVECVQRVGMAEEVERKPPFPPFTRESALAKVKAAEAAWNTRNPEVVALAYTKDSEWRNRTEFFKGRDAIKEFLTRKWAQELDYRLMKELWAFTDNHIAVRFEYEWHNEAGQWLVLFSGFLS